MWWIVAGSGETKFAFFRADNFGGNGDIITDCRKKNAACGSSMLLYVAM